MELIFKYLRTIQSWVGLILWSRNYYTAGAVLSCCPQVCSQSRAGKCAHNLGLGQGAVILLPRLFVVHLCKEGAPKATMGWLHGKWRASCPWYIALPCEDFLGHLHSKEKLSAGTLHKHQALRFWMAEKSWPQGVSTRGWDPWLHARLLGG